MKWLAKMRKSFRRDLIPAKLTYFFWNGKNAFLSYLTVFYEDIGLSPSEATLVFSMRIISQFVGTAFWSYVTDRLKKFVAIVVALSIVGVVSTFPQPFLARHLSLETANYTAQDLDISRWQPRNELLPILMALSIVGAFFEGGIAGDVDNLLVQYVVAKDSIKGYGSQRLFGAIGSGLLSLLLGFIIDMKSWRGVSEYSPIFPFHAVTMLLFFINFYFILVWATKELEKGARRGAIQNRGIKNEGFQEENGCEREGSVDKKKEAKAKKNNKNGKKKKPESKQNEDEEEQGVLATLMQADVLFFYLFVTVNGFAYGCNMGVSFLHLRHLRATSTLMGCYLVVLYVTQTVVYPFSSRIILFFGGPLATVAVSTMIYCVRFSVTAFIYEPWVLVPLQALQVVNGALLWVSTIEYTYNISNTRNACSLFGLLNAVYKGASKGVGIAVVGVMFENYRGHHTYLYLGIAYGVLFLLNAWYVLYMMFVVVPRDEKLVDRESEQAFDEQKHTRRNGIAMQPAELSEGQMIKCHKNFQNASRRRRRTQTPAGTNFESALYLSKTRVGSLPSQYTMQIARSRRHTIGGKSNFNMQPKMRTKSHVVGLRNYAFNEVTTPIDYSSFDTSSAFDKTDKLWGAFDNTDNAFDNTAIFIEEMDQWTNTKHRPSVTM